MPADYQRIDPPTPGMSNLDGRCEAWVEPQLRASHVALPYTAWDFFAWVWFEADQFHCEVRQFGAIVGYISAPSLATLMERTSAAYGSD
jgi:hypothetical protein